LTHVDIKFITPFFGKGNRKFRRIIKRKGTVELERG
jgi:hypothetical protein